MRLWMRVVVVAVVLALGGCGVPTEDSSRGVPVDDVPYDLLAPASTTTTTIPVATVPVTIFMLRQDHVVPVGRTVALSASLGRVLAHLVQGPTDQEAAAGLRSAVNPQTRVLSAELRGDIAVVDLSGAFSGIGPQEQILALAQVVYTATELPGVNGVQVLLDGKPVDVPRGDGTLTTAALNRGDYAALAPR